MAIKALNPFAAKWYTPAAEKEQPQEQQTRFKLRGLDGSQMGYAIPELHFDANGLIDRISGSGVETILGYGLVDWENFSNDAGAVPFARGNFHLVPFDVRAELAIQIIVASYVQEDQKKT